MLIITEQEKTYMIAKAKHEARQALFRELELTYRNKSNMIDRLLNNKEADNIFILSQGERCQEIYEKRTRLRAKAMESWKACNQLFRRMIEEQKTWRESQYTEGLF